MKRFIVILLVSALTLNLVAQTSFKNIRYGERRSDLPSSDVDADRLLDIFIPAGECPSDGYPTFIFIHGGGFDHGSKNDRNAVCTNLYNKGFAVVSINYFLTAKYRSDLSMVKPTTNITMDGGTMPPLIVQAINDGSEDLLMAIDWLKEHKEQYHINCNRLALVGGSAGAMIALYSAYHLNIDCCGVVDMWGELNYPQDIEAGEPPLFIIHGDIDDVVDVKHAQLLRDRSNEVGISYNYVELKDQGHSPYDLVGNNYTDQIANFLNQSITAEQNIPTVQLNSLGYATFSYTHDVMIKEGARAYVATVTEGTINCEQINQVQAGTGILLYGEPNALVTFEECVCENTTLNDLTATTRACGVINFVPESGYNFVLNGDQFKKYTGSSFSPNKAFFNFSYDPTLSSSRAALRISLNEENTISNLLMDTKNPIIYELNGTLSTNTKGLIIRNGEPIYCK